MSKGCSSAFESMHRKNSAFLPRHRYNTCNTPFSIQMGQTNLLQYCALVRWKLFTSPPCRQLPLLRHSNIHSIIIHQPSINTQLSQSQCFHNISQTASTCSSTNSKLCNSKKRPSTKAVTTSPSSPHQPHPTALTLPNKSPTPTAAQ